MSGIAIGLVNAMGGEAHAPTERRIRALLAAASPHAPVALRCFTLDGPAAATPHALRQAGLDGLIVTGAPSAAHALRDEPAWPGLARLVDYAAEQALPAMWLCMAAHAAVHWLDGIERRRLPTKLVGLMACARTGAAHPITAGLPQRWRVPHSRHNAVGADALLACDYRILSSSAEAGADVFTRRVGGRGGTRFVFCQGHPEYDAQALLREYRRDVARFLAGGTAPYPGLPRHYFSAASRAALEEFQARATRDRHAVGMDAFPAACAAYLRDGWSGVAVRLYANWLADLGAGRRPQAAAAPALPAETGAVPAQPPSAGNMESAWTR